MATSRTFNSMLNQYLPSDLFKEEAVKRDWLLQNVEMDNSWKGGDLIVPFKGVQASSVAFGALTDSTDIGESAFVRGSITTQPEVWGSLIFKQRDLMEHDGRVTEASFLKILPDEVDDFMDYMKEVVSHTMLNGGAFATATADGDASGNITVDRPERVRLKQKVYVDDGNSSPVAGYVQSINMDTGVLNIDTTRAGGTDVDLSTYTTSQVAKLYYDGSQTAGFTSLRESLLSLANGGSTNLYGVAKTAYTQLQAINVSGADITATNILSKIFDAFVTIRNRGKGMPTKVLMSYRNFGYVLSILEAQKGSYNINQGSRKVSVYGWDSVEIVGVKGSVTAVAIQEMENDVIFFLDVRPQCMKIYTNGGFKKRRSPSGIEYFEVRATTGFSYIVDVAFFGDFVLHRPSYCGVLYSIP